MPSTSPLCSCIINARKAASTRSIRVSGTAGLTGSADTILVLKREPNDAHGFLYVRGRDVHETEAALEFNNDTGRWLSIGTGAEFRMSEARKAIVAILREAREAMTPAAIATALGKRPSATRMLLAKMRATASPTASTGLAAKALRPAPHWCLGVVLVVAVRPRDLDPNERCLAPVLRAELSGDAGAKHGGGVLDGMVLTAEIEVDPRGHRWVAR